MEEQGSIFSSAGSTAPSQTDSPRLKVESGTVQLQPYSGLQKPGNFSGICRRPYGIEVTRQSHQTAPQTFLFPSATDVIPYPLSQVYHSQISSPGQSGYEEEKVTPMTSSTGSSTVTNTNQNQLGLRMPSNNFFHMNGSPRKSELKSNFIIFAS